MKKLLLLLLLSCSSIALCDRHVALPFWVTQTNESSEIINEDPNKKLIDILYRGQIGLMSYTKYYNLVNPYIKKAEKTLALFRILDDCSELSNSYLTCLTNYNVACFYSHVKPNSKLRQENLEESGRKLFEVIAQAKRTMKALKNLNINNEYNKTATLFNQANTEYYKQLSFIAKTSLYFTR